MQRALRGRPAETGGFDAFDLHPSLMRALRAAGFSTPRPIQSATLPDALEGRDVLGLAQTGTGKTAAFALPILDSLLRDPAPGPIALILAPTRELASQIDAEIRMLARFTSLTSVTIHGGVSASKQLAALRRNPHVVVGCPGRVLDLMSQGGLDVSPIEILVVDEADHMFDLGFLPDLRRILRALPSDRQNLMYSATMPGAIRELAAGVLHDPCVAELAASSPAKTIDHALYPVAEGSKRALLDRLLEETGRDSTIVFTRTKHRARRLAQQLCGRGVRAVALQGNMSQGQRERAMDGFRERRFDVLVATDIAARGIDVSSVAHVINFDVPSTPDAYTHRIGRTGRSEREGRAYTFVTPDDDAWVAATERMIGKRIRRRSVQGFDARAKNHAAPLAPTAAAPARTTRRSRRGRGRRTSSRGRATGARGR